MGRTLVISKGTPKIAIISISVNLFRPQAFDGVGGGGFDGLEADGEEGDRHGGEAADREDPPGDDGAIGELLQPFLQGGPGEGGRYADGDGYQFDEVSGHVLPQRIEVKVFDDADDVVLLFGAGVWEMV